MILVLGGTSTTHQIISELATSEYVVSVATEYGADQFAKRYPDKVVHIRFTPETLLSFIKENRVTQIIDSTHPHALQITETAISTAKEAGIGYISKIRDIEISENDNIENVSSYDQAISLLGLNNYQSIMITTGSNNIDKFSEFADKAYVRVLPFEKSIKACVDAGFQYSRIIAMQGPFSKEFNIALIKETKADCLITKNSGTGSGFQQKIDACIDCGIDVIVINPVSQPE